MFIIKNQLKKITQYIKSNKLFLISVVAIVFLFTYQLPYQVYIPGGTINLATRVTVEDGYSYEGTISSSYVSAINGVIPTILLSYIIPNWDLIKNSSVTLDDETLNNSITRDKILLSQSKDVATLVALKSANIPYEIVNQQLKVLYV